MTLQDFFGITKTFETPYCDTDQDEQANLLLTEEKETSDFNNQIKVTNFLSRKKLSFTQKEMPSGIHHARKASNRYLKEIVDTDQPEDEEQYEKPSFNTLCRREHNMPEGDAMTQNMEGRTEQNEQVEQVELGEA